MTRLSRRLALVLGLAAVLAGCSKTGEPGSNHPLTVFAAASLTDMMTEAGKAYEAAGHEPVVFSFAGSSALARQIEQGAPADIFISADEDWMDYVGQRGLIEANSRTDLFANRLVLAAPMTSSLCFPVEKGLNLADKLGPDGRLAIAAPEVPAGKYGEAALKALGAWDGVKDRLARGENVRTALQFVARGEAPYGVVYETDAKIDPKVRVVGAFPEESHPPIRYPAAILKGRKTAASAGFLVWLQGPEAAPILDKYGFSRP